jgi:hypothetical protein
LVESVAGLQYGSEKAKCVSERAKEYPVLEPWTQPDKERTKEASLS